MMSGSDGALLRLVHLAGALKRLPRQGWLHIGVPEPESVAGHSFRVALMTMLLAHDDPKVDAERALVIALCHDLPEAIVGDITPFDETLADESVDRDRLFRSRPIYSKSADRAKHEAEGQALSEMTVGLDDVTRRFIVDAWEEYERGCTEEARLVRQVDKLEALLQAHEYARDIPDLRIKSFELGARDRVQDDRLRRLLDLIVNGFVNEGETDPHGDED